MQFRLLPYRWHLCTYNSTSSGAIQLLPLHLASLYLHQQKFWCSTVSSLTVGITVPTTAVVLMQYSYFLYVCINVPTRALAVLLYSYFPYSWHHRNYSSSSSDAVQFLPLLLASVPTRALAVMQYSYFPYSWQLCTYNSTSSYAVQLLPLQLASLYLQQH